MMQLFILTTTANYPDVMMPAFRCNRLSALFFVVFIVIGAYFLLILTLANETLSTPPNATPPTVSRRPFAAAEDAAWAARWRGHGIRVPQSLREARAARGGAPRVVVGRPALESDN